MFQTEAILLDKPFHPYSMRLSHLRNHEIFDICDFSEFDVHSFVEKVVVADNLAEVVLVD
jgi:hypothetical protein